jgi:transcriptional regulator with XRE-family HTH domain
VEHRPVDPLWRTVVGTVLRAERRLQGLTLREVAAVSGISVPYLSEIERGRKEASSEMLAAAAKALGLRLVDLLARAHLTLAEHDARSLTSDTILTSTSLAAPAPAGAGPVANCSLRLVA